MRYLSVPSNPDPWVKSICALQPICVEWLGWTDVGSAMDTTDKGRSPNEEGLGKRELGLTVTASWDHDPQQVYFSHL